MTKNQAAIAALEKQLDDARNAISQLQALVPPDAKISARSLIFRQQPSADTAPAP
jgi:regulator of sirC expression with transglutaminase-like and TPR domain